jgi:hypothetical protein
MKKKNFANKQRFKQEEINFLLINRKINHENI